MTRQEFLEELRASLAGEVSAEASMDAYRYYSQYIDEGVREGKTEEEVIEELGKPSLIAKSIIAAKEGNREADVEYTEDGRTKKIYHSKRQTENTNHTNKESTSKNFHINLNSIAIKILMFLIFIVLVVLVFFVIKIGFWFLITFGIPILIILGIVYLVMYFMKD